MLGMLNVTLPVAALTAMPVPASALNTPVLTTVLLLIEMPVPAVREFCVPGNVCPAAKLTIPLLAIDSPVSAGELPFEPKSRSNAADEFDELFPVGSACHRKSWFTAELLTLSNDDAWKSNPLELNPPPAVAVPVAGNCTAVPLLLCVRTEPPMVQGVAVKMAIEFVTALASEATVLHGDTESAIITRDWRLFGRAVSGVVDSAAARVGASTNAVTGKPPSVSASAAFSA